jgi:hypothetical protein
LATSARTALTTRARSQAPTHPSGTANSTSRSARSLGRRLDELTQLHGLEPKRQSARADPRCIQKRLEHFGEPVGLLDDGLESGLGSISVAAIDLSLRHLRRCAHHRDGIAEVMRRNGHELLNFSSAWLLLVLGQLHFAHPLTGYRALPFGGSSNQPPLQVMGQRLW